MKYCKLAFQYLKRRWFFVLLYAIVPALVFTLTSKPTSIFNTIVALKENTNANFVTVWLSATELNLKGFLFLILSSIVLVIFMSALFGGIERDMRLGDLTHKKFFSRVNNNFLIVLKVFLVFVVFLELFGLINSAVIYLWYKVFDNYALFVTFSLISLFIMTFIAVGMTSLCVMWIPTMIMTGLNMRKSLVESLQLIKGNVFKMLFCIMLPAIPFFVLAMLANYFDVYILKFVSELLVNLFAISYYPVLMFATYFEATGADREDLRKKIWEVNK